MKTTPLVFLTATVLKEEAQAAGGVIGGYNFLAKPATTAEIINCIEKHTGK